VIVPGKTADGETRGGFASVAKDAVVGSVESLACGTSAESP
jgi:hypothetical protein